MTDKTTYLFKQHLPEYFEGERFIHHYHDTESLLANPKLQEMKNFPGFYRYSISKDEKLLMCEHDEGKKWYVYGYLENIDVIDLPEWLHPSQESYRNSVKKLKEEGYIQVKMIDLINLLQVSGETHRNANPTPPGTE